MHVDDLERARVAQGPRGILQLADLRHAVGDGEADGAGLVHRAVLHTHLAAGHDVRLVARRLLLTALRAVLLPEALALRERKHTPEIIIIVELRLRHFRSP